MTLKELWDSLENKPKFFSCFLEDSFFGLGGTNEELMNNIIKEYGNKVMTKYYLETVDGELTLDVTLKA